MRKFLITSAALGLAAFTQYADAATVTGSLSVTAGVSNVCSVNTATVAFGPVALSGTTDTTGTVNVTCTSGGGYVVSLDNGLNAVGAQRKLTNGSTFLNYDLFSESSRSTPWNSTSPTGTVAGTGTGSQVALTVYGRIPSGQPIVVGAYTDTITVSVVY